MDTTGSTRPPGGTVSDDDNATDRIIAAQREEAARTRRLHVQLAVGITVIAAILGLLIWGIVVATHSSGSASYQPGPLTNSTPCGVFNADQAAGDSGDVDTFMQSSMPAVPGVSFEAQINVELEDLPPLVTECRSNPSELLSAAYNKAVEAAMSSSAPTP